MEPKHRGWLRETLVRPRILCITGVGLIVAVVVGQHAQPWLQFALLATVLCWAVGLLWELRTKFNQCLGSTILDAPFLLAHDADVFEKYRVISTALLRVSPRADPVYRAIALDRLTALADDVEKVAAGTIVFDGTETWRIVYEQLLRSPGLHLYRSVAWVQNESYWQDEPGRQSMQLNLELHRAERVNIERIVIIADNLWPRGEEFPCEQIRQWVHEQHSCAIWIKLVRESALKNERELLADMGIYGSRAVGVQELDEDCRTTRFALTFDFDEVAQAEERWKRLAVYATLYGELLDRVRIDV